MRLAVVSPVYSVRRAQQVAVAAERAGYWGVGVPDTAPRLYQGTYPIVTACLLSTSRVHVGPFVTNPVTRHWSIHTSNARALTELGPGRFFLGVSTGDGAVHSVGLKPATWSEVERFVELFKSGTSDDVPVFVATSGPRGANVAGRVASDAVFSQGFDRTALRTAISRASQARSEEGIQAPLRKWTNVQVCVVPRGADLRSVRAYLRGRAYGHARYRFDLTFDEKNVPEEWQPVLRERFAHYDYTFHGSSASDNPNSRLFEDRPDIEDYLIDRSFVVGSLDDCAERLAKLALDVGLDGFWLGFQSPTRELDPLAQLLPIASALQELTS